MGQTLTELARTARSIVSAGYDWLMLRTQFARFTKRERTFAFLVHPRTDSFVGADVYGENDIYRPFPALRWAFALMPHRRAERFAQWFARKIVPITLSRIKCHVGQATVTGYLLSTVRTPTQLMGRGQSNTREHLADLFALAARKGVQRVGLGALLPAMTGYGKKFAVGDIDARPVVSTGHAYTAYTICEYLKMLVTSRSAHAPIITVAIVGGAGSTGKATMRMLKRTWAGTARLNVLMHDVVGKEKLLSQLVSEAEASGAFNTVRSSTEQTTLLEADYIIVVSNATGSIIRAENVRPGTVVIDDSQPRNTGVELVAHGAYVLDVLARVPGLDVGFDFGFRTSDRTVTFTCLAETVLATFTNCPDDLAVGEVTDVIVERTLKIVELGRELGLIGELPLFSFGRELSESECEAVLRPVHSPLATAAE